MLNLFAMGIGALSNILGIGGGTLSVSLLLGFKMPDRFAIGTSAAVSFVVTSIGAVTYVILGWHRETVPGDIGFINLQAFFVVGVVSFFTVPFGVRLMHRLPSKRIKQLFAIVLGITGIFLIF